MAEQMTQRLSVSHLLGIKDLLKSDIELILRLASDFKQVLQRPIKKVPALRDITVANLFFENSTRTKMSFELAEKRLSTDTINFSASSSSLSKGESLLDTVRNILSMKVDMIVMRHAQPGSAAFISQHVDAKIVNAGDGVHEHPTQALLDAMSLEEKIGNLEGKKMAIIGDVRHSRVALSNIHCMQKLGAEVMLCGPSTLLPYYTDELGVHKTTDLMEALDWCDAANVLRIQLERQDINYFPSLREYQMYFGLTMEKLNRLGRALTIMHPGPINRGVEIDSDLADSEHSLILHQVENGVAVRMAVLFLLAPPRNLKLN
jgi:aspartate carbamoyltransferase catalytic subunit